MLDGPDMTAQIVLTATFGCERNGLHQLLHIVKSWTQASILDSLLERLLCGIFLLFVFPCFSPRRGLLDRPIMARPGNKTSQGSACGCAMCER